jgi:hypothetical protein
MWLSKASITMSGLDFSFFSWWLSIQPRLGWLHKSSSQGGAQSPPSENPLTLLFEHSSPLRLGNVALILAHSTGFEAFPLDIWQRPMMISLNISLC